MKFNPIIFPLFFLFSIFACSELEREIDLELPTYDSRLVVECYLEDLVMLMQMCNNYEYYDF